MSANSESISTSIELSGKTYQLKYPLRILRKLETELNVNAFDVTAVIVNPNADRFLKLLWLGMLWQNPELKLEEVENQIDGVADVLRLMPSITAAYIEGMPKDEELPDTTEKKTE